MSRFTIVIMVLTLGLVSCSWQADISVAPKELVGTWEARDIRPGEQWQITYKTNGIWQGKGRLIMDDVPLEFTAKGNWKLDGARLSYDTTSVSDNRIPRPSGVDTLVAVTTNRFDYKPSGRNEITHRYRAE